MPTRTTTSLASASFIVDPQSIDRNSGRNIDWANVATLNADGKKFIPAGTAVGSLLGNGLLRARVVTTNPAIGFLATDAIEDPKGPESLSGYGVIVGGVLYENLLPDATGGPPKTLPAAIKTELAAAGTGFAFETYQDTRS